MPIKRINVDGRTGSIATVPVFGNVNEIVSDNGDRTLFKKMKPKAISPGKQINDMIRQEVLKAAEEEAALRPFLLKGRGHEPRMTLSPRMAGILRGQDLPRLRVDGYGPNHFYPARIFVRARKALEQRLGWTPIEFDDGKVESSVYRVNQPNSEGKQS